MIGVVARHQGHHARHRNVARSARTAGRVALAVALAALAVMCGMYVMVAAAAGDWHGTVAAAAGLVGSASIAALVAWPSLGRG